MCYHDGLVLSVCGVVLIRWMTVDLLVVVGLIKQNVRPVEPEIVAYKKEKKIQSRYEAGSNPRVLTLFLDEGRKQLNMFDQVG